MKKENMDNINKQPEVERYNCCHCKRMLFRKEYDIFKCGSRKMTCNRCLINLKTKKVPYIKKHDRGEDAGERGPIKKDRGICGPDQKVCSKCRYPRDLELYKEKLNGSGFNKCCNICLKKNKDDNKE
jgi:hypothetical protein